MTNTLVTSVRSPDGRLSALLVDRRYEVARSSDELFVVLVPEGQNVKEVIAARDLGDSAALVATRASKLQFRWQSDDQLVVICGSCGLESIDVEKKLKRIGTVTVQYEGFPAHTANE